MKFKIGDKVTINPRLIWTTETWSRFIDKELIIKEVVNDKYVRIYDDAYGWWLAATLIPVESESIVL